MPSEDELWVSSNLRAYCAPGTHDFLPGEGLHGGVRWCPTCLKEEPADASGCIICDQPGRFEATLAFGDDGRQTAGRLCPTCHGALTASAIGGWRMLDLGAQAQPAEVMRGEARR